MRGLPVELRELSASYRGANPEGTSRWIEIERSSRQEGSHSGGQRRRKELSFAVLETLKVPVLLLVGDADQATPPSQMRMFAKHLPGSMFATVPEAGHAAFWEQPEIWNQIVLGFIGAH
jgi:pimeloyl-ACP methyl ester carboxylesterase